MTRKDAREQQARNRLQHARWERPKPWWDSPTFLWLGCGVSFLAGLAVVL